MSILRVHYRERQRLSAVDMRLEQDYLLGLGGRHELSHHGWGVVRGLRLIDDGDGGVLLTPGVAIDGYGREIVVLRALAVDVAGKDPGLCWSVLLYYCEQALLACGKGLPLRTGPRPVVVVTAGLAAPEATAPDLATARSAGEIGRPPWPLLLATFGAGCSPGHALIDHTHTIYCAHRAASVRAPNGRALLKLGLTGRSDFYDFAIATGDTAAGQEKRIGIDRHATVHFWRPLHISAKTGSVAIMIGKQLRLLIEVPMPAGIGATASIGGEIDARLHTISAALRLAGSSPLRSFEATELAGKRVDLKFAKAVVGTASLQDTETGKIITFGNGRRRFRNGEAAPIAISAPVTPQGARLILRNTVQLGTASGPSPCDVRRNRDPGAERTISAMLLRPAPGLAANPLTRDIYALDSTPGGAALAVSALHISGGEADDTDTTTRFSIGVRDSDGYHAALSMDGGRHLVIAANDGQPPLKVDGTVYLPPIGAKDPLLPEMLILAYMGGLRRIGNASTVATITLTPPAPPPGVRVLGLPLEYHINVHPAPGIGYRVKRVMELVTAPDGKGDLSFRALTLPPASGSLAAGVGDITLPHLKRIGHQAEVVVLMLVEVGQKDRIVESNALLLDLD